MLTFWPTAFIAMGVGLILLLVAVIRRSGRVHDFTKEAGIAFIIASIVTATYELHARSQYDKDNIESVLHAVMGEIVPHEVWEEVKSAVIQRSLIRKDFQVRMKVNRDLDLPSHQAILTLELVYNLHGLQPKEWVADVTHTLSREIESPKKKLPRFEQIIVGDSEYDLSNVSENSGEITLRIPLNPRNKPPTRVITRRREVINVPGPYYFSMTEITQGVSLEIDECPPEIEPEVKVISDKATDKLKHLGNHYYYDGILLPGQSIRIGFKQAAKSEPPNVSSPSK